MLMERVEGVDFSDDGQSRLDKTFGAYIVST